jgi:uncharacterized protein (DUF608 family)
MNQSIYPSYHSTARILLGKDFCTQSIPQKEDSLISVIIESSEEIRRWENIAPLLFSQKYTIFTVTNIAEFFVTNNYTKLIRIIPGHIIRDTRAL